MKFILPLPPGINKTYGINRNYGGPALYKRGVVRDWEYEAGWVIKRYMGRKGYTPFKGRVEAGITWYVKFDRDIDAGIKVLLDVFQKQRVYANDRQVRRITHVDIVEHDKNPRVEVELNEMA